MFNNIIFIIFIIVNFLPYSVQYSMNFFNHWICIGIKENIDFSKPYKINVGDLPLVVWKDKNSERLTSAINICSHMGSKLDNGVITDKGCLKCQYHGLEMSHYDRFGETMEHEGKIFWSYNPIHKKPFCIPYFNNKDYETSYIEKDMHGSLTDSAFNTMDIRHPEYVHNIGFGSKNPPLNIKQYKYNDRVGLYFEYQSNKLMQALNDNIGSTQNYHMFVYPTFTWSRVSFNNKHLIIAANLLPLEKDKTRWYVTIHHNYNKNPMQKQFIKMLANTILSQDYLQMENQHEENKLKKEIIFKRMFKDEEVLLWLNDMFKNYKYPDINVCTELYKNYANIFVRNKKNKNKEQ